MSARVKVNLLQEGRSVLVDVGSGAGMTDLRKAILAAVARGGKVPRNFLDLNRHFLEHRPGDSRAILKLSIVHSFPSCMKVAGYTLSNFHPR